MKLITTLTNISLALLLASAAAAAQDTSTTPSYISDNSFLLEEAYNQEPGVVQHINFFNYNRETGNWVYSFTQEWPIFSQDHQFSYTLPVEHVTDPDNSGLGDILLNYRYQLVMNDKWAVSPRLSLSVPTGDEDKGLGAGNLGYQANLPISINLSEKFTTHLNGGFTWFPDEQDISGASADTLSWNYGASLVYHDSPVLDVLVEFAGLYSELIEGENSTTHGSDLFISPGIRGAINYASGLQIVPGLAFPVGIGPNAEEYGMILYLSFEHPF